MIHPTEMPPDQEGDTQKLFAYLGKPKTTLSHEDVTAQLTPNPNPAIFRSASSPE